METGPSRTVKEHFGALDPSKTALVLIEFQNEFCTRDGKLFEAVRENMEHTNMLANTKHLLEEVLRMNSGVKIFFAPITFNKDSGENPNKHIGILAGCDYDNLFKRGTWNADCCEALKPVLFEEDSGKEGPDQLKPKDLNSTYVIKNKHALSAFKGTDLQESLNSHGIQTIAFGGFMANCCVESSMREAYDMGYNCISLIDCVSTVTMAGYEACTKITYPFVSTTMKSDTFCRNLKEALFVKSRQQDSVAEMPEGVPAPKRQRLQADVENQAHAAESEEAFYDDLPKWGINKVDEKGDVFRVGPWQVDVRQKVEGEVKHQTDGRKELERYIYMAQCFECESIVSESIYTAKLNSILGKDGCSCTPSDEGEAFGWGCCMTVLRLPSSTGCLIYSPVLDDNQKMDKIHNFLESEKLLPVRYIMCPTPQHHLCLREYREAFPRAFMVCTETRGGVMPPLHKRRRDLNFDCILHPDIDGEHLIEWKPSTVRCVFRYGSDTDAGKNSGDEFSIAEHRQYLEEFLDIFIVEDNRTTEMVLIHKPSSVLIMSDLLYKTSSRDELKGPGGLCHRYSFPKWFAQGQEDLFYKLKSDKSNGLLPAYRTHPKYRKIDVGGCGKAIRRIIEYVGIRNVQTCLTCHTDPLCGQQKIVDTIRSAWAFTF